MMRIEEYQDRIEFYPETTEPYKLVVRRNGNLIEFWKKGKKFDVYEEDASNGFYLDDLAVVVEEDCIVIPKVHFLVEG